MYSKHSIRAVLWLSGLALLSGCASQAVKVDQSGVESIRQVALVAFTVPAHVAEKAGSGSMAGLSAAMSFVRQAARGKPRGNGEEVAADAAAGFIAAMEGGSKLKFVDMGRVASSPEFERIKSAHDQAGKGQGASRSAYAGLPVVVLTRSAEQSEFAAQAASALGVDGVVMVDVNDLHYFLYTGVAGSGEAKARGSALFKLFDKSGRAVWEAPAVVYSQASAGMVNGALIPGGAPALHRSVGASMAEDVLKSRR
jgi:hypothetical protein